MMGHETIAGTDATTDPAGSSTEVPHLADAVRAAAVSARSAGVTIRELADLADFAEVCRLFAGIWEPDPGSPPVTTELLRALATAGSYLAGAFDGGHLVGAAVGFFGSPADKVIHSHIAGVSTRVRGRNVGFALKAHQRAWAMLRGVSAISWTFDPLIRRNAYFNVCKLAALPCEYLPNFYGVLHDRINEGDDSDRLLVKWPLSAPSVVSACAGIVSAGKDSAQTRNTPIALGVSNDDKPIARSVDADTLLIAVPPDIEGLRLTDPHSAKQWRVAVRETLGTLMANGGQVTGFDRQGWYIVATGGR